MHHDFVRPAAILHIRKTELGKSDPRPQEDKIKNNELNLRSTNASAEM